MLASSFARVVLLVFTVALFVRAQQSTGGGGGTVSAPTTPAPTTPTKGGGGAPIGVPSSTQPSQSTTPPPQPLPIYISGVVRLPDGSEPPERVVIERLCSSNSVRFEGYTDSKGRFGFHLGLSQQLIPDASNTMFLDGTQGLGRATRNTGMANGASSDPNFDCELRARLAGYTSSTVLLAGHKAMDNPDVGTIVLYPFSKIEGKAISATSATAPKAAHQAFEKGMSEAKKKRLVEAEKQFRIAVDLHPKYAEAWLQLGKTYAALKQSDGAREAFKHSIAADPSFVYPYEQLYEVAFQQGQWQELADTTERLLRLNPYEFPAAFYYNGVAHYQLHNWDTAEKSLIEAIRVDQRNSNPKTRYVLGLVLVQKRQYAKATENLTMFIAAAPNDEQVKKARSLMDQIAKVEQ